MGNLIPDSYLPSIFDIDYYKLQENGIRYIIFDLDCTVIPIDSVEINDDLDILFRYIKNLGMHPALFSSNFESKVKPVADSLDINYACLKLKPFASFREIEELFDYKCNPDNTVYVGDSFLFDMIQADKLHVYKILVDMIRDGDKLKLYANDFLQMVMKKTVVSPDFKVKRYYRGYLEK